MGDVHIPKPPPNAVGARVEELVAEGHQLYSNVVTGQPAGRVRRPTLFTIAIIGTALAIAGLQLAGVPALIAMVLLLASDAVVEL